MRQHSRLTLRNIGRIEVSTQVDGQTLGQIADLSVGGLRVIATRPLEEGASYPLCLHVPDHRDIIYDLDIVATCRWVRKGSRRNNYELGFSLDQPSEAFTDLIGQLLPRRR